MIDRCKNMKFMTCLFSIFCVLLVVTGCKVPPEGGGETEAKTRAAANQFFVLPMVLGVASTIVPAGSGSRFSNLTLPGEPGSIVAGLLKNSQLEMAVILNLKINVTSGSTNTVNRSATLTANGPNGILSYTADIQAANYFCTTLQESPAVLGVVGNILCFPSGSDAEKFALACRDTGVYGQLGRENNQITCISSIPLNESVSSSSNNADTPGDLVITFDEDESISAVKSLPAFRTLQRACQNSRFGRLSKDRPSITGTVMTESQSSAIRYCFCSPQSNSLNSERIIDLMSLSDEIVGNTDTPIMLNAVYTKFKATCKSGVEFEIQKK